MCHVSLHCLTRSEAQDELETMHQAIVYEALHLLPGRLQLLVFEFEGLSYLHADAFILELGRWLLEHDVHGPLGQIDGYAPFITIQADRLIHPSRYDGSIFFHLMAWSAQGHPPAQSQLLPQHRAWLRPFMRRSFILGLFKDRFWHHVPNVLGSFVDSCWDCHQLGLSLSD